MAITRSFKMPDLLSICHFPSSMSPDSAKASADSIEWICSTEALGTNDEGANKRWHGYFSQAGGTLLASYVYCYTPYEKLRLCCDLVNVLFAMDEITDTQSGAEARGTMEHHIRILCGEASDNTPVSKMTSSFRARAEPHFRPHAFRRFLDLYQEYARAVIREAELREKSKVLPVEEYRVFRRKNGAVQPCFGIIQACFNSDLPDQVFENPTFLRIYNAALDMVLWSNDLYSYRIEYEKDGPACSNVITSLIHERAFSLQDAADYIGLEFKSLLSQFLSDKAVLPSFGSKADAELKAYIFGLETWIIGNLRFSLETPRYLGEGRAEIRKTLVVKLSSSHDIERDSA